MATAKDTTKKKIGQCPVEKPLWQELNFPKLMWIFTVGCFIGYVVEVLTALIFDNVLESRQGMVYGPFNQVYGMGAVVMTVLLLPVWRKWGLPMVFIVGAVIGGIFEYSSSYFEELIFGTRSWDFSHMPAHFNGRTSLFYMLCWALLATGFIWFIYPRLSRLIDRIPRKFSWVCSWVLLAFFVINLAISGLAVDRWRARNEGVAPKNVIDEILDDRFTDERMRSIYPHMQFTNKSSESP